MTDAPEAGSAARVSMSAAVAALADGTGAGEITPSPSPVYTDANGSGTSSPNLESYLYSLPPAAAAREATAVTQPWQADDFRPTTRTLVEAVKAINIQDVQWFLHQLDLHKNGGKRSASAAAASSSAYLAELPENALQLPTSSPYILDILMDTIFGLQARSEFVEIRAQRRANVEKARAEGLDLKLVDLLTPLPPIAPPSLYLPSPLSEHAFQTIQCLVEAVDIVGVNTLSRSAAIDYLKVSNIPYPIGDAEAGRSQPDEWVVRQEWKDRVKLLEEFGVVLDVDRAEEDANGAVSDPDPTRPPRLSEYVFPPFTSVRATKEQYLKHVYLLLLEKRQLFLKLVSSVLTRVRNLRAQGNYQLAVAKDEAEKRHAKIIADIAAFEEGSQQATAAAADAQSQAAADTAAAEQLERRAVATRREEWTAHRDAVAVRGARLIHQQHDALVTDMAAARERYLNLRAQGIDGLQAVEAARTSLAAINQQFDKAALTLESRTAANTEVAARAAKLADSVSLLESGVKAAKRSLKDIRVRVDQSRATAASLQVAQFDIVARGVMLHYARTSGVSNLFLKFFRCMSGAPDPNDPAPEVVWCPDACAGTELCSPSATRTVAQVANPAWKPVKIDLWKLCEAEHDRYFKIEVWDCDASVRQVASVVRGALEQARADTDTSPKAADEQPELNPDGSVITPPPATAAVPTSVTLPSSSAIKYSYIGQSVCTLQQLLAAQRRQREILEENGAEPTPGADMLALTIINAERWATRNATGYKDSGTLVFTAVQIGDAAM